MCIKHINKQRSTNPWQQNTKLFFIHWSELNLTITATVWNFSCSTVGHISLAIVRSHTVSAQLSKDTQSERASTRILQGALPMTDTSTNSATLRPEGSVDTHHSQSQHATRSTTSCKPKEAAQCRQVFVKGKEERSSKSVSLLLF